MVDRSRALLLKMLKVTYGGRSGQKRKGMEKRKVDKVEWHVWGEQKDFRGSGVVVFQAERAHGSTGLKMDPGQPPPRCQCYDMCTAPLFSFTTRALHLPGWPSLIKKTWFTSDHPPSPLPVALTLHFLWTQAQPSGVINNGRMEWGKVSFPLRCTAKGRPPFILLIPLVTMVSVLKSGGLMQ